MPSCTRMRLLALQHSPMLKKAPRRPASTAASRSASSMTIMGFLPPSSSDTFFRLPAAARTIALPTAVEPVNDTMSTSSCSAMRRPTGSPYPVITLMTPLGTPAVSQISASNNVVAEVNSLGLITQVQPAAKANGSFWLIISIGKFQGVINPTTPIGSRSVMASVPRPKVLQLSPYR